MTQEEVKAEPCASGQHCVDAETRCCIHCDYVDPLDACPECDALQAKLTEARDVATKWCKHALSRISQLRAIRAQVDRLVAWFECDPQGDATLPPDLQALIHILAAAQLPDDVVTCCDACDQPVAAKGQKP